MNARVVLGLVTALLLAPGWSDAQPTHPAVTGGRGNVGFWLSVPEEANSVFDDQMIRMIVSRARFVILNAPMEGPTPQYTYEGVVKRLHEARPDLPVLIYTWATFGREGRRIGEATMTGLGNLGPLLLREAGGDAIQRKVGGQYLGDPRKKGFRDWHVDRVDAMVRRTGADGVHLDGAQRTNPIVRRTKERGAAEEYGRGMDALFQALKARLGPSKLLTFNGWWTHTEAGLADQERLLASADGVTVEFFGSPTKEGGNRPFRETVLPYLKAIPAHPRKLILVLGRGPIVYAPYEDDYLWQRYLYASYLMGAGRHTVFKYQADFPTVPRVGFGRTGSLDVYADWDVDLGDPQGASDERGGVFARRFARGLALMVPHDGHAASYTLPRPMFTPEGEQLQGAVALRPAQGLLLLDAAPAARPDAAETFRGERPVTAGWRWAKIADVDGKQVLRLERTPAGDEWEHDLLLDGIRTLRPATKARLRVRSEDAGAELRFVAEVDDREGKDIYAVATVAADGKPRPQRTPAAPFRVPWKGAWSNVSGGRTAWATGKAQDVEIDGPEVFRGNARYTFRRWTHVRVVGAVDVESYELAGRPAK